MKKVLALILSVVMLLSITAGMEFSAYAEEMALMLLGSNVESSTYEDEFTYEIQVDGQPYEANAYDMYGEEQHFIGTATIPADNYYEFEIPYGSEYKITRLEKSKTGYEALKEVEKTGTVDMYSYSEEYTLDGLPVVNKLTEAEFNAKTNNGENEYSFFYYEPTNKDIKETNELVTGTFYSESLQNETEFDLGYLNGTQVEYKAKLEVTAKYNIRKPLTSKGRTTYYYTGKIILTVGDKTYEQEYATIPANDSATAKSNAISTITPVIRGYASQALTDFNTNKEASIYYTNSIEAMLPIARDLTTSEEEAKIVDSQTKLVEFKPYQKVVKVYNMVPNDEIEVFFDGAFVIEHVEHIFTQKLQTVEPTCIDDGYDVYGCEVENCPATKNETTTPADEKYHLYSRPVSNNDAVSPTCTEKGMSFSQTQICDYCGKKVIIEGSVIDAKGHLKPIRATEENKVDAKCETNGSYDEVYYCARNGCGAEISREKKTTDKLGHSYDAGVVTTKATCTKEGVKTFTCKTCGKKKTEKIKATGHKSNAGVVTTKATCGKNGVKTYSCTVCKATIKTETIKATGNHTYDKGKVTKAPTSTNTGVLTQTCTVCKAKKTTTLAKLPTIKFAKLTATKKGFKATWKKNSKATGYQIRYSTSSKMSKAKTVTISKNSTTSKAVSKLKAKKKYYVQIRTYTTINGKKYYSAWSKAKAVTTKK